MKVVVQDRYGPPDVLEVRRVAPPIPGQGEVRVRVRAIALNPADWHVVRGLPYLARIAFGLRRPADRLRGTDVAGEVDAVGAGVTLHRPGDRVFGWCKGAPFAELVCVREDQVAAMPANLSFEQAAAVPLAATTALQALRDKGRIRPGDRVLVNGASGGVGTFAVQIAKWWGAEVTGVCSPRNADLVRSLGADHVIDYTAEDFTRRDAAFDCILDNVGNHRLSECRRVLADTGTLIPNSGSGGRWFGPLGTVARATVMDALVRQRLRPFFTKANRGDLLVLKDLIEAGSVTPVVDRVYRFDEIPAAIRHLETGRARGKVVVSLPGSS
ncbi:MAG TPA: NAD(P)-dependent alcohol dehydrogenase [Acidimicrobiales bacterium]|nr:NAD(P)-dependent alcohol dehydrogenase [Acidimicrobiales bacterium]